MRLLVNILLVVMLAGCSYQKPMLDTSEREVPVIRYVQVEVLYQYLLSRDGGASSLQERSRKLFQKIQETEDTMLAEADPAKRKQYQQKLEGLRKKLRALKQKEGSYKKRFLDQIEDAAKDVARRHGYNLVLGGGNTVIYSKKEYDITRQVLRELVSRKIRGEPVNR